MAASPTIPVISSESNLSRYLQEIRRFPMLAPEEEYMLGKSWREHGDIDAAHKLVTSHLRLVAKIAMGYRGYGLPLSELISEGNVGNEATGMTLAYFTTCAKENENLPIIRDAINWLHLRYNLDRKSKRLNSSHRIASRMPSSA